MSVTFWCPDAPDDAPEVNVSGGHAALQLAMLGVECDGEPCGRFPHAELPGLIRTVVRALASDAAVHLATQGGVYQGSGGAKIVDLGMSEERLKHTQDRLMELFAYAIDRGLDVHYG